MDKYFNNAMHNIKETLGKTYSHKIINENLIELSNKEKSITATYEPIGVYDISSNKWVWSWVTPFANQSVADTQKQQLEKHKYASDKIIAVKPEDVIDIIKQSMYQLKKQWFVKNNISKNKKIIYEIILIDKIINYS